MTVHYEEGDCLKGDLVVGVARKLSKPMVVVRTGRHKAQRILMYENVFCRIEKKMRFIK